MDITKFQQQLDQLNTLWAQAQQAAQDNELSPLDRDTLMDSIRGLYKLFFENTTAQTVQHQELKKEEPAKREVEFVINEPVVEPEKVEEQPVKKAKFIYTNTAAAETKTEEPIVQETTPTIEQPIVVQEPVVVPPIIEIAKPQLPVVEDVKPIVETKIEEPMVVETPPTKVEIIQNTVIEPVVVEPEIKIETPVVQIIQMPVIEEVKPMVEPKIEQPVIVETTPVFIPPVIENQVVMEEKAQNNLDAVISNAELNQTPKLAGFNQEYDELFSFQSATELSQKLSEAPIEDLNKSLGLNEKYLYINELFAGKAAQFKIAIDFFNSAKSLDEARDYMERELIEKQQWMLNKDKKTLAKNFVKLVRRRYLAK